MQAGNLRRRSAALSAGRRCSGACCRWTDLQLSLCALAVGGTELCVVNAAAMQRIVAPSLPYPTCRSFCSFRSSRRRRGCLQARLVSIRATGCCCRSPTLVSLVTFLLQRCRRRWTFNLLPRLPALKHAFGCVTINTRLSSALSPRGIWSGWIAVDAACDRSRYRIRRREDGL